MKISASLVAASFVLAFVPLANAAPFDTIASDLGVSTDVLKACVQDARTNATGDRGTGQHRDSMRALTLACLQKTKPDLTADQLTTAMANAHPGAAPSTRN